VPSVEAHLASFVTLVPDARRRSDSLPHNSAQNIWKRHERQQDIRLEKRQIAGELPYAAEGGNTVVVFRHVDAKARQAAFNAHSPHWLFDEPAEQSDDGDLGPANILEIAGKMERLALGAAQVESRQHHRDAAAKQWVIRVSRYHYFERFQKYSSRFGGKRHIAVLLKPNTENQQQPKHIRAIIFQRMAHHRFFNGPWIQPAVKF